MRQVKLIVVHCSDSDDSLDFGFKDVDEWHRQRGWLSPSGISCGYHYIVRRDGRIEPGRPESEDGAHCQGNNSNSIGICWIGRKQIGNDQYKSLLKKLRDICDRHGISVEKVLGHCETESGKAQGKTCPNLSMPHVRADLLFTLGDDKC
jgi:N-acetyl-anhydromuramyl-L-alanine amidase AmpD